MKKAIISFVLVGGVIMSSYHSEESPRADISNGIIKARLYLPDTKDGYYMATRFDWSGVISSLEYKGHHYFGQWFEEYSPTIHDAIMGPVEEFGPLNYDEAGPWGTFVKIGVGVLTKPADKKYSSFTLYPILDPGYWKIEKKADGVQFMQELNHKDHSYEYSKSVQLVAGKSEMVISHVLVNTGERIIETDVYNHNFFMIDNQPTGPGLTLTFPVDITGTGRGIGDIAELRGNRVVFKRDLVKGESVFCRSLEGINERLIDYDIQIDNLITGAGVRIRSDQPLSKMVLWACSTTLCPEPYIHIKVEPGKEFRWSYSYEFYVSEVPEG
jgi:hypothetical protein